MTRRNEKLRAGTSWWKRPLFAVLIFSSAFAFAASPTEAWSVRGEVCYLWDSAYAWDDFSQNLYTGFSVDWRVASLGTENVVNFYLTPAVVFNAARGIDLQIGLRIGLWGFESANNVGVLQGATFPTRFLSDCNVYVRVNLASGTFQ